jgi:hypothetical protein
MLIRIKSDAGDANQQQCQEAILEMRRLTREPWRLTPEPWRLAMEPRRLTPISLR